MLDEMKEYVQGLNGKTLEVPIRADTDEDGYLDRECPAEDCLFRFKVHIDDWTNKTDKAAVHCAFCGHVADDRKWFTADQLEQINKEAIAQVRAGFGLAMRKDAETWNQRQNPNAFLKITLNVSSHPQDAVLPAAATDPMRMRIECQACGYRYAVIGSAFFCPGCGHNAAEHVFRQSLGTIRASLASLPAVRAGISDADTAENLSRLLIESGLQNAVTAFQRYAEALYGKQTAPPKIRRNVFQNLADGSEVWKAAFAKGYDAHLLATEMTVLGKYFQQRHLLAHTQGLVDEDYLAKTGDTSYRLGQRLVSKEPAVLECVNVIEKLAAGMESDTT